MVKKRTRRTPGPKPTWATPKALLSDFEAFLDEQKPHVIKELRNVRRVSKDREHIKRPTASDYEWTVEEIETLSPQGLVTITQFAAWKGVHRKTIMAQYSEGPFKETYETMLAICEAFSERRLYDAERGAAAIIFAMKNSYGWIDKTETELSGAIDTPLSKEARAALNKALNGDGNENSD